MQRLRDQVVRRLPRQDAAVELKLDLARDDVDLLAAVQSHIGEGELGGFVRAQIAKAGLVPLHVWLPLAHPAAPSHVSALMSGVMTKVAVQVCALLLAVTAEPPNWVKSIVTGVVVDFGPPVLDLPGWRLELLRTDADLGRALVAQAARVRIDHGDLTALLYLQGYRREEFVEPK